MHLWCARPNLIASGYRGCLKSRNRLLEPASRGDEGPFSQPFFGVSEPRKRPLITCPDPSQTPSSLVGYLSAGSDAGRPGSGRSRDSSAGGYLVEMFRSWALTSSPVRSKTSALPTPPRFPKVALRGTGSYARVKNGRGARGGLAASPMGWYVYSESETGGMA